MKKNYYKIIFIFSAIFLSVKSYAIELTNDYLYGAWKTEILMNTKECAQLTSQEMPKFKFSCKMQDKIIYNRDNTGTSNGSIKMQMYYNDKFLSNETIIYIAPFEWTLYPEHNELLSKVLSFNSWMLSNPNEKVDMPSGATGTDKIKIIDQNTMKMKMVGYNLEATYKRIQE